MLILNYALFIDYLTTSWFAHVVFILPVAITTQLIFLYKTISIQFNYQLNNIATILFFVYMAQRHYRNYRIELENFVTKQENDLMRKQ